MFCNASATLYHDNGKGYDVTYFERVFWQDTQNAVETSDGKTLTANIRLVIPTTVPITVTDKDFFVKGKGAEINNESEATISASIKALGKIHGISAIRSKLYGSPSIQHYSFDLR